MTRRTNLFAVMKVGFWRSPLQMELSSTIKINRASPFLGCRRGRMPFKPIMALESSLRKLMASTNVCRNGQMNQHNQWFLEIWALPSFPKNGVPDEPGVYRCRWQPFFFLVGFGVGYIDRRPFFTTPLAYTYE